MLILSGVQQLATGPEGGQPLYVQGGRVLVNVGHVVALVSAGDHTQMVLTHGPVLSVWENVDQVFEKMQAVVRQVGLMQGAGRVGLG